MQEAKRQLTPEAVRRVLGDEQWVVPAKICCHQELRRSPLAKLVWAALLHLAGGKSGYVEKTWAVIADLVGTDTRSLRDTRQATGPISKLASIKALDLIGKDPLHVYVYHPDDVGKLKRVERTDPQQTIGGFEDEERVGELSAHLSYSAEKSVRTSPTPTIRIAEFFETAQTAHGQTSSADFSSVESSPIDDSARNVRCVGGGGGFLIRYQKEKQTSSPDSSSHIIAAAVDLPRSAWRVVRKRLSDVGVFGVRSAIEAAKANQIAPESVLALADYFEVNRQQFESPGALHDRILAARPNQPIDDIWPDPTKQFVDERRRELSDRASNSKKVEEAARKRLEVEDARIAAEQEERWGPLLDSLPAELLEPHVPTHLKSFWRTDGLKNSHVRIDLRDKLDRGEISIETDTGRKARDREPRDADEEPP